MEGPQEESLTVSCIDALDAVQVAELFRGHGLSALHGDYICDH